MNREDLFECFESIGDISIDMMPEEEIVEPDYMSRKKRTSVYKDAILHIASPPISARDVLLLDDITIDHCVLYCNDEIQKARVNLSIGAKLHIKNSLIISNGYNPGFMFEGNGENRLVIENTSFINCANFIKAYEAISLTMNGCRMMDCYRKFIDISGWRCKCRIENNTIVEKQLIKPIIENAGNIKPIMFDLSGIARVRLLGNKIFEDKSFRKYGYSETKRSNEISYFQCEKGTIIDCEFDGISKPIVAKRVIKSSFKNCIGALSIGQYLGSGQSIIEDCVFENCTDVIKCDLTRIRRCSFNYCYNSVIEVIGRGGVLMDSCTFTNIENRGAYTSFSYQMGGYGCIEVKPDKENLVLFSRIRKCTFSGINIRSVSGSLRGMGRNYLIMAKAENNNGILAYVDRCIFLNCSVEDRTGRMIKRKVTYKTPYKKVDFWGIKVKRCTGLANVRHKGS